MSEFDPICKCTHPRSNHEGDEVDPTFCNAPGCPCTGYVGPMTPEQARAEFDPVKIPSHYNQGTIEVANFIADQKLEYPFDNIVKYAVRAGKKDPDKKIQDIEKAAAYLQMAHNLANGLPAVVRDPDTNEVVWTLFKN